MADAANVPLSVLDLATVKQGESPADAFAHTLDLARHVERLGYTRYWLAEHHNMPGIASSATSVLIGYVAGGTRTIRVGSGGVMLPNHAPLVIAEQFGTLAALYPDRIDLGLGRAPGTDQLTLRALRRSASSADDFPDQVQEIRALLAPAEPGQRIQAIPGAGSNVPVWLLGSSDFSAHLAGLLGLPYAFAAHFAPAGLFAAIQTYRHAFQPSEVLREPYLMIAIPVVAAETDQRARVLATSLQQRVLSLIRGEPLVLQPPVEDMANLWNDRGRAAVEQFLGAAIVGGPETVGQKLANFRSATRADEIMVASDTFDHAERLRSHEIIVAASRAPVVAER
jgi:luciferase family oxidoreductase group 1